MHKKGRNLHIKGAAFSEIFILIIAIAAFAFVLAESERVSAQEPAQFFNNDVLKQKYMLLNGKSYYLNKKGDQWTSTAPEFNPKNLGTGSFQKITDENVIETLPIASAISQPMPAPAAQPAPAAAAEPGVEELRIKLPPSSTPAPTGVNKALGILGVVPKLGGAGVGAKNLIDNRYIMEGTYKPGDTTVSAIDTVTGQKVDVQIDPATFDPKAIGAASAAQIALGTKSVMVNGQARSVLSLTQDEFKALTPEQLKSIGIKEGGIEYAADGSMKVTAADGSQQLFDAKGALTATVGGEREVSLFGMNMGSWGPTGANLIEGLGWGIAVGGIAYGIAQMAGQTQKQSLAIGLALSSGIFAGKTAYGMLQPGGLLDTMGLTKTQSMWAGGIIGIAVAAAIFLIMYKKEKEKTIKFTCMPWQPPLGGSNCEKCNGDKFRPCSEYRCKALGQACELLNADKPGKELCTWKSKFDVNSAKIEPWTEVLKPDGLLYEPDKSVRPPAIGVKIVNKTGPNRCLKAFTPLQFGIKTDKPAQCKIDYNHTASFGKMAYYFGDSNLFSYEHTQQMRLPGPDIFNETTGKSKAPLIVKNDGTTTLFVRCKDANGNENVDEYEISYCVDKSPDATPPRIEGTSIPSGSPVQFNISKVPIEVYTNEPSECKWTPDSDKAFEAMENNMSCAMDASEINTQLSYTCSGNLTGIKDREENKYYFRCKDQPDKEEKDRNVMVQGYELKLKGSQPLNIISTKPNETVKGSTEVVKVDLELETSAGSEEGKAFCFFAPTKENESFVQMFETNNYKHKQTLQLTAGTYTYYFRCADLGGNSAESNTTFDVFSDRTAPQITRIYRESAEGALKIVTNEDAECTYSTTTCNYKLTEGLKTARVNAEILRECYAPWVAGAVYYIKCRDLYGNEPNPNECSIIASTVQTGKETAPSY